MKILRLRFKNIHSLKGEHLIDFTQKPLVDAGLFAITGATGAGKSTILDVITLALFNKIPRFSDKGTESVSKNEIEKSGSIITHFTNDAYAEIEYLSNGTAYRSKWSISTARTGNLRDYEMELATIEDQKILPLKKSEVPPENEKILGLKYDQFIRSILLSQGDFARFLKSDDKERAKLLENITGSQIYRIIGAKVNEHYKLLNEQLETMRIKAKEIVLLSSEEWQNKKDEIAANEEWVSSYKQQADTWAETLTKIERKQVLLSTLVEIATHQSQLQEKIKAFEKDQLRLTKHRNLEVLRSRLVLWQDAKLRLENLDLSHQSTIQALAQKKLEVSNALQKMGEFTKTDVNAENFMSQMKAFEIKIIEWDNEIRNLEIKGKDCKARYQALFDKFPYPKWMALQSELSTEVKYQKACEILENLKQKVGKYAVSDIDLEELLKSMQDGVLHKTTLLKDLQNKEELVAENTQINQYNAEFEIASKQLQQDSLTWTKRHEQAKNSLALANERKLHWLKMASLDQHRNELVDGEPCPLCGAKEHPYADHLPSQIGNAEIEIHTLNQEIELCELNLNTTQKKLATLMGAMNEKKERQKVISNAIEKWNQKYPSSNFSANQVSDEIYKLESNIQTIKSELAFRKEKVALGEAVTALNELMVISMEYKQLKASRMELYQGHDINGDADKIQNLFVASKESYQNLQNKISHLTNEMKALKVDWEVQTKTLEDQLQQLGYQHPDAAFLNILSDEELQRIQLIQESLLKTATELGTKQVNIQIELKQLEDVPEGTNEKEALQMSLTQLNTKRDEALTRIGVLQGEIIRYHEQEKYLTQLKKELAQKENKARPFIHLNALIGDASGHKFAKFAQNLSLRQLINLANVRLAKLTDRYSLAPSDIEDDLKIIDHYQGDTVRSVKTLSGGETFIVSLALALSLADMASQNVRLECLFIDEGFGTLDAETMETALLTLEKLQADSNRMIGIISHVESLKERIATQIKVHKNNRGHSTIEVVDGNFV